MSDTLTIKKPDPDREMRRKGVRPWARSRIVIALVAVPAVVIQALYGASLGFADGVRDGVSQVRQAWSAMR